MGNMQDFGPSEGGLDVALNISTHATMVKETNDFGSPGREPLDLSILDQEFGKVLFISSSLLSIPSVQRPSSHKTHPVDIFHGFLGVLLEVLPNRLSIRAVYVTL